MKTINLFTLLLFFIFSTNSFAEKKDKKDKEKSSGFQGQITYTITYEGRELSSQEETQMPNKKINYYVGSKEIEKNISPMGYYIVINDRETNEFTVISEMMGQKMYGTWINEKKNDSIKAANKENITINKLDGIITIAGYKCKKAEVIVKDKKNNEQKIIVYYTESLKPKYPDEELDLGGMVLKMELTMGDPDDDEALTMVYKATEVKKGKVKKSEYAIPSGAKKIEKEDLKRMLGGSAE